MAERTFTYPDSSLISCDEPCAEVNARLVESDKIKQLSGVTTSKRCIANGAFVRGKRHSPTTEEKLNDLKACRVCTIYTEVDNASVQA